MHPEVSAKDGALQRRRASMRRKIMVVLAWALGLAFAGLALAQMAPMEVVAARDAAMNAGDVDATVALYADDATYTVIMGADEEPLVLTGKAAIADRLAGFAAANVRYGGTALGVVGDTARVLCSFTDDGLRSEGVDHLEIFEEFTFMNGEIVDHTMTVLRAVPVGTP